MSASQQFGKDYFRQGGYEGLRTGPTGRYFWSRRFYSLLVERFCKSGSVLEIGCGLGHLLARLQDRYEAYGIDISPYAIDQTKEVAPRAHTELLEAEGITKFGHAFFNGIVAIHVFEHLSDPALVARSCSERLAPGGVLIIATPNLGAPLREAKGTRWYGYTDPTHISLKPEAEWRAILTEAGLNIKRVFGDGMWDVPYVPLVPSPLQLAFFGFPAVLQTISGIPVIPARLSESLIMVAEKP